MIAKWNSCGWNGRQMAERTSKCVKENQWERLQQMSSPEVSRWVSRWINTFFASCDILSISYHQNKRRWTIFVIKDQNESSHYICYTRASIRKTMGSATANLLWYVLRYKISLSNNLRAAKRATAVGLQQSGGHCFEANSSLYKRAIERKALMSPALSMFPAHQMKQRHEGGGGGGGIGLSPAKSGGSCGVAECIRLLPTVCVKMWSMT